MKTQILLRDKEFEHIKNPTRYADYSFPSERSIEWIRSHNNNINVVVFTERCYKESLDVKYKDKIRIAWALESHAVHPYAINDLRNKYHSNFQYIITHDKEFIEWLKNHSASEPIYWTPFDTWMYVKDHKLYNKNKDIQIIASNKRYAEGHKLRHEVIRKFGHRIDGIYGRAYKKFNYTLDVFKDYRYAIVIENVDRKWYFSDKLMSAFQTGTIPIYWNTGWINKFFDINGMLLWHTLDELDEILNFIKKSPDFYDNNIDYIKNNFEKAKTYYNSEDWLYNSFKGKGII